MELYHVDDAEKANNLSKVPTVEEFEKDYQKTTDMVTEGYMRTYCFQRLQLLSSAFRTHVTMNAPMGGTRTAFNPAGYNFNQFSHWVSDHAGEFGAGEDGIEGARSARYKERRVNVRAL